MNEIENLEYDFEHFNHGILRKKIKKIVQSRLIQELPMRLKLHLEYYQIFSIQFWDLCTVPDDITEIIDNFNGINPENITDLTLKLLYTCIKAKTLEYTNNIDHAIKLLDDNQVLITQLEGIKESDNEVKKFMGLFYYISARIYQNKENTDSEQLEVIKQCSSMWAELQTEFYNYLAFTLEFDYYTGDTKIDKINQCLSYFNQKETKSVFTLLTMLVLTENYIFSENFNLQKALEVNTKAIELLSGYKSDRNYEYVTYLKARIYNAKGILSDLMGDFKLSLTIYLEVLQSMELLQEKFEWGPDISSFYGNVGEAYTEQGDYEKALNYQLKSYRMRLKATESPLAQYYNDAEIDVAESCYQLIRLYLLQGNRDKAIKYTNELEILSDTAKIKSYVQPQAQYNIAQALMLIKESNFKNTGKAKDLLSTVIEMPVKFELLADALLPLVEIIVKEYQTFQNDETLEEFNNLNTTMTTLVEQNHSVILQVNFLILQSKIAFINGNFLQSEELYLKSLKIAKEFNLENLITKITTELDYLIHYLNNSAKLSSETSIRERFDSMEMQNYFNEINKIFKQEGSD